MPPWLIRRSKFKLIQTVNSSVLTSSSWMLMVEIGSWTRDLCLGDPISLPLHHEVTHEFISLSSVLLMGSSAQFSSGGALVPLTTWNFVIVFIIMIWHSNYCFQAIVSYWGEALQGKTWLPMKLSIYLSILFLVIVSDVLPLFLSDKIFAIHFLKLKILKL